MDGDKNFSTEYEMIVCVHIDTDVEGNWGRLYLDYWRFILLISGGSPCGACNLEAT